MKICCFKIFLFSNCEKFVQRSEKHRRRKILVRGNFVKFLESFARTTVKSGETKEDIVQRISWFRRRFEFARVRTYSVKKYATPTGKGNFIVIYIRHSSQETRLSSVFVGRNARVRTRWDFSLVANPRNSRFVVPSCQDLRNLRFV